MLVSFDYDQSARRLVCIFYCDMNTEAASRVPDILNHKLEELLSGAPRSESLQIVFDLARVGSASSLFLRIALMAARKVRKEHFTIRGANEHIRDLLTVAGCGEWLSP